MARRYARMSVTHLQPFADQLIFEGKSGHTAPSENVPRQGHKIGHSEGRSRLKLVAGTNLNETLFASLSHARSVLSGWRYDYNHVRPHSGIGGLTPADAARRVVQPRPQGHDDNPGLYL